MPRPLPALRQTLIMPMQYIAAKAARLRASIEHPRWNRGGDDDEDEEGGGEHAADRHEPASIDRAPAVGRHGRGNLAIRPPCDDPATSDDEQRHKADDFEHDG